MKKICTVFWQFLSLGLISFGGPAAHIGYFRNKFVQELKWIDDSAYARLIALSQFLPGPGSSQVGFALGLKRAGVFGGIAAFLGFTLPSFLLMYALSVASPDNSNPLFSGIVSGLKLLAVVVVADATLSMFKSFCKEKLTVVIAVGTAVVLILWSSLWSQIILLITAGIVGLLFYRKEAPPHPKDKNRIKKIPLVLFFGLLASLPFIASITPLLNLFSNFYETGSLVFGGGHVVLPILQQFIGEAISTDRFLIGYAAAQAVPGPMFSFASFLGAELTVSNPMMGALIATFGVFLPGFLLVISLQGAWESLASSPKVSGAAAAINAAVVGLLFSALYKPVFISAVHSGIDMIIVLIGFIALRYLKWPIVLLVIGFGLTGLGVH